MSDPLSLFPLAIAAAGGCVDAFEAQQLVAAGLTLKQRAAPLVRALTTGRSAILLPPSPAFWVALAASDGCGALVVNPGHTDDELAWQLADANVRAVFTLGAIAPRLGTGRTIVLLDHAPASARVLSDGRTIDVDLGSHHGLELEGDQTSEGRDEECVMFYERTSDRQLNRVMLTQRGLLASARAMRAAGGVAGPVCEAARGWSDADGLIRAGAALLSGARVTTANASRIGTTTTDRGGSSPDPTTKAL